MLLHTLPHDDGELVAAAMAYLTLALMQADRPDAHLVISGAPVISSYFWPTGWTWEPEATARENVLKARDLVDTHLAEPDQAPVLTHGYPRQSDVAAWNEGTNTSMDDRTLDLLREVGALRTALLVRQAHGDFEEWSTRIRVALGDVFLHLLDLAEYAGFDLETTASLRWRDITAPKDVAT